MKAIVYHQYGTPVNLQLAEVEKPNPKKNEVLVKIYASSINSWDWDSLRGNHFLLRLISGLLKPRNKILGGDISGIVEAIGSDVKEFQPGDEVFGDIAGCGFGGFAEYVAVPEKYLAKKSARLTFEQAASIPQAGLLALQGLRYKTPIKKGQHVLINGAGGGVGTLALQYAKSIGAEVTCVDSVEKFEMLRSLGADHLIDFKSADYTQNGKQYDYILDVIAHRSISDYKRALKPKGTFVMIGGSMGWLLFQFMILQPILTVFSNKKLGIMGYRPNRKDLEYLNELFENGKVIPVIDKILPLKEVPEALQYLGDGLVKGKIVIKIKSEN